MGSDAGTPGPGGGEPSAIVVVVAPVTVSGTGTVGVARERIAPALRSAVDSRSSDLSLLL